MGRSLLFLLAAFLAVFVSAVQDSDGKIIRLPFEAFKFFKALFDDSNNVEEGTRWAILIAGSNGYWNYRHQHYTDQGHPKFSSTSSGRFRRGVEADGQPENRDGEEELECAKPEQRQMLTHNCDGDDDSEAEAENGEG
ncbi:hypothetical protein AHAS_Ahas12G0042000 [Arachis hypogaea]